MAKNSTGTLPPKKKKKKKGTATAPLKDKPERKTKHKPLAKNAGKRKPARQNRQVNIDMSVPMDEPDAKSTYYLRNMAGLYYATSVNGITIAQLQKHPIFQSLSLQRLEGWSSDDKWVERRRETQEKLRAKLEDVIAGELVKSRVAQLQTLQNVFDKSVDMLLTGTIEVNSYEGLMGAVVRLGSLIDDWRSGIADQITPQVATIDGETSKVAVQPRLTKSEAEAVAKMLIHKRREEFKQQKDQSELHVVDGEKT